MSKHPILSSSCCQRNTFLERRRRLFRLGFAAQWGNSTLQPLSCHSSWREWEIISWSFHSAQKGLFSILTVVHRITLAHSADRLSAHKIVNLNNSTGMRNQFIKIKIGHNKGGSSAKRFNRRMGFCEQEMAFRIQSQVCIVME